MEHWDKVFEEVPASFEARIVSTLASLEEKPKIRRFRLPGGLIAAALAIVVLGGTAFATDLFGLRSITVSDPYATPEAAGDVIALQGVPESAEFKANARWMEYLTSADVVSRGVAVVPGFQFLPADELAVFVKGVDLHIVRSFREGILCIVVHFLRTDCAEGQLLLPFPAADREE